ncbi:MAG: hypothetical protein QME68_06735 [Elusimicrobiota bacterium]|nr:hypothetical protein [Elusimicrobiota bacterium]
MSKGKLLHRTWSPKRRKTVKCLCYLGIPICVLAAFDFYNLTMLSSEILFATTGILLAICGLFTLYLAWSREFQIYENGLAFPRRFGRFFFSYSNISEIRLNTQEEQFIPKIEIKLKDGTTLKYPKTQIHDWKEFHRVMLEDLKGRVKVVE